MCLIYSFVQIYGILRKWILCLKRYVFGHGMLRREIWCPKRILCGHGMGEGKGNGGAVSLLFQTGFGLRHPRSAPAGALKSRPLCCAQCLFAPFHPLCKRSLQRSVIVQKRMMPFGIIRSAFERKTGFEPAALSLGS